MKSSTSRATGGALIPSGLNAGKRMKERQKSRWSCWKLFLSSSIFLMVGAVFYNWSVEDTGWLTGKRLLPAARNGIRIGAQSAEVVGKSVMKKKRFQMLQDRLPGFRRRHEFGEGRPEGSSADGTFERTAANESGVGEILSSGGSELLRSDHEVELQQHNASAGTEDFFTGGNATRQLPDEETGMEQGGLNEIEENHSEETDDDDYEAKRAQVKVNNLATLDIGRATESSVEDEAKSSANTELLIADEETEMGGAEAMMGGEIVRQNTGLIAITNDKQVTLLQEGAGWSKDIDNNSKANISSDFNAEEKHVSLLLVGDISGTIKQNQSIPPKVTNVQTQEYELADEEREMGGAEGMSHGEFIRKNTGLVAVTNDNEVVVLTEPEEMPVLTTTIEKEEGNDEQGEGQERSMKADIDRVKPFKFKFQKYVERNEVDGTDDDYVEEEPADSGTMNADSLDSAIMQAVESENGETNTEDLASVARETLLTGRTKNKDALGEQDVVDIASDAHVEELDGDVDDETPKKVSDEMSITGKPSNLANDHLVGEFGDFPNQKPSKKDLQPQTLRNDDKFGSDSAGVAANAITNDDVEHQNNPWDKAKDFDVGSKEYQESKVAKVVHEIEEDDPTLEDDEVEGEREKASINDNAKEEEGRVGLAHAGVDESVLNVISSNEVGKEDPEQADDGIETSHKLANRLPSTVKRSEETGRFKEQERAREAERQLLTEQERDKHSNRRIAVEIEIGQSIKEQEKAATQSDLLTATEKTSVFNKELIRGSIAAEHSRKQGGVIRSSEGDGAQTDRQAIIIGTTHSSFGPELLGRDGRGRHPKAGLKPSDGDHRVWSGIDSKGWSGRGRGEMRSKAVAQAESRQDSWNRIGAQLAVRKAVRKSSCHIQCTAHGTCDEEMGRCDCPYGYGRLDCSTLLTKEACEISPGYNIPCGLKGPTTTECRKACKGAGMVPTPTKWAFKLPVGVKQGGIEGWANAVKEGILQVARNTGRLVVPLDNCPNNCSLHGWCDNNVCECFFGYGGRSCQKRMPVYCLGGCSGRGRCVLGFCHCLPGFYGADCALRLRADGLGSERLAYGKPYSDPDTAGVPEKPAATLQGGSPPLPRIYVYELPPNFTAWLYPPKAKRKGVHPSMGKGYLAGPPELFLHEKLMTSQHRTLIPEEADYFFVPTHGVRKDAHWAALVSYLAATWPFWERKGGRDHLFVFGGEKGACDLTGQINPLLINSILLTHWGLTTNLTEAGTFPYNHGPCFRKGQDIVLPTVVDISVADSPFIHWELQKPARTIKLLSAGATGMAPVLGHSQLPLLADKEYAFSHRVRQKVWNLHRHRPNFSIGDWDWNNYTSSLERSVFCLAPSGLGFGIRVIHGALYGCIPVIIQDNVTQPYEEDLPYSAFSLRVAEADIPHLHTILDRVSSFRIGAMQKQLACVLPHLLWTSVYGRLGNEMEEIDAFSTLMWVLQRRVGRVQNPAVLHPLPPMRICGKFQSTSHNELLQHAQPRAIAASCSAYCQDTPSRPCGKRTAACNSESALGEKCRPCVRHVGQPAWQTWPPGGLTSDI